ncbi:MAG: FecR domain-containing protein, partial [Chthoniobacterales bacterium]|nr:FecR domain-containing protein [Chthoniobacterales bacterium]
MKTFPVVFLLALAFLLGGTNRGLAELQGGKEGNARVLKVQGSVTVSAPKKPSEALKEGGFVQQNYVIKTGADSKAWLLFSNGATITIQPNTTFAIDTFLQTPFDSNKTDFKNIKEEPSISQTKLSVNEGSVVADVAKLNKGSTFGIGTPLGVAGIRGTLIQVTVTNMAGGRVTVTVNLPHGLTDVEALNGQEITLTDGQKVTLSRGPNGTLEVDGVRTLDAQTIQQIQSLIEQIADSIPDQKVFEGVYDGAPEIPGGDETQDGASGFGGDQGTGNVGTAPLGGGE